MKKYYYLAAFVSVLVLSWLIQTQSSRFYAQPIIEVQTVQVTADQQQIQGIVRNGEEAGVLRTVTTQYTPNGAIHPLYQTRQQLLLQKEGDGWQVQAQKRDGYLFFFLALFLMAVVAIGGKKGLRALLSIFVNTGLLLLFLWFHKGNSSFSLVFLMIVFTIVSLVLTMGISYGFRTIDSRKIIASLASVLLAFFLCRFAMDLLQDHGLRYEEMSFLTRPYRSVYLGSLLIGAIGASMDNIVMLIASLDEIQRINPQTSRKERLAIGRSIAQDTTSSMINVLLFAYLSGSMPALLFYLANGWLLSQALPMHLSLEIVRTLCGGFALVLSVPLTLLCFELQRRKAR